MKQTLATTSASHSASAAKHKSKHREIALALRVFLGLSLFVKGISFVRNDSLIRKVFQETLVLKEYLWLQTFIPWFHLLGGFLIIIGLFTRIAALSQIPILICAIIFANASDGVFIGEKMWPFSAGILLLLVVFLISGGGYYSLDRYSLKDKKEL